MFDLIKACEIQHNNCSSSILHLHVALGRVHLLGGAAWAIIIFADVTILFGSMRACLFGRAPSLGGLSVAIIFCQVAVLTEALAIVEPVVMRAGPGLLGATTPVIAVDAHVLCIVLALLVRALLANTDRRELLLTVTILVHRTICIALIISLRLLGCYHLHGLAALGVSGAPTVRVN
jgi:hypothetical protein